MQLLLKLALMGCWSGASALWTFYVIKAVNSGLPRLLLALPVVVAHMLMPLVLDYDTEPLLITPVAGCFSLAAFKVLALCLNRGPLVPDWTLRQFLGVMCMPIIPAQMFSISGGAKLQRQPSQGWQLLRSYYIDSGVALTVSWILMIPHIPVPIRHWLYTLGTSTFLGATFDMLGEVCRLTTGVVAAPAFDKPWLCESFADFWARRWNLVTTYMMRVLVYEPIMEGHWVLPPTATVAATSGPPGIPGQAVLHADGGGGAAPAVVTRPPRVSKLTRFTALQASFLVSGLWHILIFYYNTYTFSWRWCLFFTLQAPILMVERQLTRSTIAAGLLPPWPVRVFLANFLLIMIARPLFFGPADTTGFAQRNLAVGQQLLGPVLSLMQRGGFGKIGGGDKEL